jgi:hypothetical protein
MEKFDCQVLENNTTTKDNAIHHKVKQCTDIGTVIKEFISAITEACDTIFQVSKPSKRTNKQRSVPRWTRELTILRKKSLALRRRYQRTKADANLRQERRLQYLEGNRTYQTKLREEKIRSWKEFCTSTDSTNPWNAVYRYAARKLHEKPTLSTFKTSDNTYTTDTVSTVDRLLDQFIPDDEGSDEAHHKQVRRQVLEPLNTIEDVPFTKQEIHDILYKFDPRKAPGKDALISEILTHTFRIFPNTTTEIYNECLRRGQFPKQ